MHGKGSQFGGKLLADNDIKHSCINITFVKVHKSEVVFSQVGCLLGKLK